MAKITQVTIVNSNTLRLDVDAKQGDEINLVDIVRVDSSFINKLIVKILWLLYDSIVDFFKLIFYYS